MPAHTTSQHMTCRCDMRCAAVQLMQSRAHLRLRTVQQVLSGSRASRLQPLLVSSQPNTNSTALQVEEGTPFARRYSPGEAPLPTDAAAAAMYCRAAEVLGAAGE